MTQIYESRRAGVKLYPKQKIKKADKIDFLKQGKRGSNPR